MTCRGVCHRHAAFKRFTKNPRYEEKDEHWCKVCEASFDKDAIPRKCPCCGWNVRTKKVLHQNRRKVPIEVRGRPLPTIF